MQIIINPPSSSIAFELFNMPVRWYGIILTASIFVGIFLSYHFLLKKKLLLEAEYFLDFTPYLVLFSIIGARLFYVLGQLDFYLKYPKEIIMINHGGISIYGAIVFGLIGIIFACKFKKINFYKMIDCIALTMPLCQSIGRWGNYFNQEAYGLPSDFFIKMFIQKEFRHPKYLEYEYFHPAFLYESILDLVLFFILLKVFNSNKNKKNGIILFLYLILYSIARIVVELIRIDSVMTILGLPVAVFLSLLIFIFSAIFLFTINKKDPQI